MTKNPDDIVRAQHAKAREKIKRLFSTNPEVRADAVNELKKAWNYESPAFDLEEIAQHGPQAASLTAMRRDTIKEVIDWFIKL